MKSCTLGKDGIFTMHELASLKDTANTSGLSLFCFTVYIKDAESTKTSYEFELLQRQFKHEVRRFCVHEELHSWARLESSPCRTSSRRQGHHRHLGFVAFLLLCLMDTGSTKTSHEFDLPQMHFKHEENIFSCTQRAPYGNVEETVAPKVTQCLCRSGSR